MLLCDCAVLTVRFRKSYLYVVQETLKTIFSTNAIFSSFAYVYYLILHNTLNGDQNIVNMSHSILKLRIDYVFCREATLTHGWHK